MIKPDECKQIDGMRFKAELVEMYSPVFFSVHIVEIMPIRDANDQTPTNTNYVLFQELCDELQNFYSSTVFEPLSHIEVGMKCILKHTEHIKVEYHRCIILKVM